MPSAINTHLLPVTKTVAPADEAKLAVVLQEAVRSRTAVYPVGGGTALGYGARPSRTGIALSTTMLKRVVDYPSQDLTVTIEAGMTMAALERLLTAQGQWLPIDVAQPGRATVGGMVAVNAYGPRRYAYGTIRDYILGIRAVDGRGEIFGGGGRVVKNVAGYNIPRLLVGSFGTVGVITEVTLLVRPLPQSSAVVACDVASCDEAESLLASLTRSQTLPVAVELLAGQPGRGCPLAPPAKGAIARLLVGFDGSDAEVHWMVQQLTREWKAVGVTLLSCAADTQDDRLWKWLANVPADMQINVLPSEVVAMVEEMGSLVPDCSIQAHAGNGVIRVGWTAHEPPAAGSSSHWADDGFLTILRQQLRPAVAAAGGSLVVLSTPSGTPLDFHDIWGLPGDGIHVMRSIQERFDPEGILNPGRFIFGN